MTTQKVIPKKNLFNPEERTQNFKILFTHAQTIFYFIKVCVFYG